MRRMSILFVLAALLVPASTHADACPTLTRTLKPKSRGVDVTVLQAFLALDPTIYPERTTSGYYGILTTLAVQRFQARHGLVDYGTPELTGWGVAGPATRAAISASCTALLSRVTATTTSMGSVPGVVVTPNVPTTASSLGVTAPTLTLLTPSANARVLRGTSMSVRWSASSTPAGAAVALWLLRSDTNETIGLLAKGLAAIGTHAWQVPPPGARCDRANPIDCISLFAGIACPSDSIAVCASSVVDGSYRIVARLYTPATAAVGRTWTDSSVATFIASAVGAPFTVGSPVPVISSGTSTATTTSTGGSGGPAGYCQYVIDGKWYPAESRYNTCCTTISPTAGSIQCAAATSTVSCPFMRCVNGSWLREGAYNLPFSQAGGCTTPWGGKTVLNGHAVAKSPYFNGGSYAEVDPQPRYVCHNGNWAQEGDCNQDGPGCYVD